MAVVGNSGSGKSCTTAKILQEVVDLKQSQVVLFDMHGEYRTAFSDESGQIDVAHVRAPQQVAPEQQGVRMQVRDPARIVQGPGLRRYRRQGAVPGPVDEALEVGADAGPQEENDRASDCESALHFVSRGPQPPS